MPTPYARFSAAITAEMSLCGGAYDGRHTRCTTTAVRAADGRRTTNKQP